MTNARHRRIPPRLRVVLMPAALLASLLLTGCHGYDHRVRADVHASSHGGRYVGLHKRHTRPLYRYYRYSHHPYARAYHHGYGHHHYGHHGRHYRPYRYRTHHYYRR